MATPFAKEYDAPWLYGVAAVTNLARVGSRQHWVSDTVLGYAIGKVFWEASRAPQKGAPRDDPSLGCQFVLGVQVRSLFVGRCSWAVVRTTNNEQPSPTESVPIPEDLRPRPLVAYCLQLD